MQLAFQFMVWPTNPTQLWSLTVTGVFFYCDCLTSGKFCMSKHSCSYVIIIPWNNIQKRLLLSIFSMQKRLWRDCTFAQANLSLRPGTEISCAGSNNDLCTVYKNSECYGEAAPATMAHIGSHQCVVSMRQKCSQCVVIRFLNKTLASLARKKIQSGNRFLDVITCKYDNSCA